MKRSLGAQFIFRDWKPSIVLLLITPILTELLTNNIPVTDFFQPKLFLTLAIIVYGPVLLLRELAIRWNLKLTGYLLLGLVYGIYNEGLLGKTFFKVQIAGTAFSDYGFIWGTNLSWAAVITVFHAFYAFLFPVLIVYYIFPKPASGSWINTKWWIGMSILSFLYVSYKFLENTWPVTPLHYVVLILISTGLIALSKYFKGGLMTNDRKRHLWLIGCYGILFVATTFTVTYILASSRINSLFFLAYTVINMLVAVKVLDSKYSVRSLLIFALCAELGFAASAILVAVQGNSRIGMITGSGFVLVFAAGLVGAFANKTEKKN